LAALIVVLQRGFADDAVTVRVNGEVVFAEAGVTTKLMRDYATSFQSEVPGGLVNLEILVPTRNLAQSYDWNLETTLYVGLSIALDGSTLECRTTDRPFAYL
jgi:hypothetical protein